MTNHIHLIISTRKDNLSDNIRDFKKFTASQIVNSILENTNKSRKSWLLWLLKKDDEITIWQEGYHTEEITSLNFFNVKQDYIHFNPV